jgi:exopolysaccharide biosynthesis polyprenyl glycosylphosphotransferase
MTDTAWIGTTRELAFATDEPRTHSIEDREIALDDGRSGSARLGRRLRCLDGAAVVAAASLWELAGASLSLGTQVVLAAVMVGVTLAAIASHGLYRARVCAVRSVELVGLARSAAIGGVATVVVGGVGGVTVVGPSLVVALATFAVLAAVRGGFVAWLRRERSQGRYRRSIVVVGGAAEAERLVWLLRRHPELGLWPVGIVNDDDDHRAVEGVPWLGGSETLVPTLSLVGANGVVIASGDLESSELSVMVRSLLRAGVHVQLSSGLWGIDHQRLRPVPLAHEPFVYVEPPSLRRGQRAVKRALDVTASAALLVLSAPVMLVAMLAVKLQDGASPIFRQVRVGKDGETFTLFKLRTMVPNAEQQLVDVTSVNQRAGGPLFKATDDPRRTRVGRILEKTSLDELPQLLNVLMGDMSLVGPRPALPHEVAQFDDELLGRHRVQPGITGLWQVEARDKPDFEIYRRLDLFYVENWSIGLDLAIMLGTVCSVLGRVVPRPEPAPVATLDLTESVA